MKKFATRAIVADLDNLAELFQNAGSELGVPTRIAMDFAYRCDLLSDAIEKLAGDDEEEEKEEEEKEEEKEEETELEKKAFAALQTLSRLAAEEEAEEEEAEEEEAEEAEEEEKESSKKATLKELSRLINRLAGDDEESEEESEEEKEEEKEEAKEEAKKEARQITKRQALATLLRIAEEEEKELGQQDDQALETETDESYMKGFSEGSKDVAEVAKAAATYRKRLK